MSPRIACADYAFPLLPFVASEECVYSTGATFDFIGGAYMR